MQCLVEDLVKSSVIIFSSCFHDPPPLSSYQTQAIIMSSRQMMNSGRLAFLMILLIFTTVKSFSVLAARKIDYFTKPCDSLAAKSSCNGTLEDKRAVPTGANPLHNSNKLQQSCNLHFAKTGLSLSLGSQGMLEPPLKYDHQREKKPCLKFDHLFPPSSTSAATRTVTTARSLEPSLTLGLSDKAYQASRKIDVNKAYEESADVYGQSSPHSAVSSFSNASIKRERDLVSEEIEVERVSSRVSDEDDEGSARKKLRLTKEQSVLLEDSFKEHSTLNPKQKQALAKQLNLRPRQVEVWFQNRRARTKLKQTEVDCEFLKKCCETLTNENRRLQKELQELKALKLSTPLFRACL
ncbi:hypothetical protein HHK36_031073 [Tetracentron sinense]|uniref:Homeobox domain-containing protein n=1 Tax=Tetracentron sinense TaxID=13715 RepID=A0A834YAM7_TETSI|nr:hypothetical protein HHK36_031073 [Tetracentron sinense]